MLPNVRERSAAEPIRFLKSQSGEQLPYLMREQKLADLYRGKPDEGSFDLGGYVRDAVLGAESKTASGTALVPTAVSARIIDMIRAQAVFARAGAGTISISGPTNMARVTGSPTVYVHTEAATDISESDVTAEAVALNPKTLAVLVPLTVELVQDSPNLDQLLQVVLANTFAAKVDALCVAAITGASGLPVSAAAHDPALWTGCNAAITAALAANQDLPRAHISTPANFAARSAILASTAGSWLGKPPYLAGMQELFTTSMTADQALLGDFEQGLAICVRSQLTVEIVRHGKPTSGQHLLVAHARVAPVVLQPSKMYWQKKVP
jgi:HK97 family phage major capsid protein